MMDSNTNILEISVFFKASWVMSKHLMCLLKFKINLHV